MKAKDIVQISNNITGEDVVAMPLWVWKLTRRKPFEFLFGYVVMDYKCDPQCKKSGLWHLWSAFRVWCMCR